MARFKITFMKKYEVFNIAWKYFFKEMNLADPYANLIR